MIGYIYLITDTTNNMKYVGQHHYHIEGQLDPNYHGSGHIIRQIYKKRPETLKEEYIKTCYSEEEMNSDEQYYIKLFKTLYPNGYNLTEGGDGGILCEETRIKISKSHKGKTLSEEHRIKIGNANKGKPSPNKGKTLSEEHRIKIGNANKGKPAPNKGIPTSDETKKKISNANKGKPAPNKGIPMSDEQKKKMRNDKRSKKVLQFTLDGEFVREWPSTAECGRNGYNEGHVAACCRGEEKSHKGYIFQFKD